MSFSVEQLTRHSEFVSSLRFLAEALRARYDSGPRIARLLASHQRWLLTQMAYALYLEYDPAIPGSGLTVVKLRDVITEYRVASRNTVLSYVEELLTYRFIVPAAGGVRRPRRYEPSEISHAAMISWYLANLAALDMLDNGGRAVALAAHPELVDLAQPRMARHCLEAAAWREPPERVGQFLWTEAGGLVMDHLLSRVDLSTEVDGRVDLGRIDTRAIAAQFMMSRTHLQRLLRKAADHGSLGWYDEPKKTRVWMSRDFLDEYCRWQAVKLAAVDEAFAWAQSVAASTSPAQ
ncbi:hypothetical protein QD460_07295 [Rhizobium jaguaris]|uniref:Uncharacterized protein n=1 Tax=Rhizobium jaguaris TaxID=1312183 RepID=A0A387FT72_9HYPH|nr:hypothetical protein [Rhizobium jaguaris]AYG58542.1 hypothetical protein CCGE525_06750 [Rhizobium jaguaris]